MRVQVLAVVVSSLLMAGCSKDTKNNGTPSEQGIGPFTIYGELACPANSVVTLLAAYNDINSPDNAVASVGQSNTTPPENPEFYIRKISSAGFIVYTIYTLANDTSYLVWYESDITNDCSFSESGCGSIGLETFQDLNDISANKYLFNFVVEDAPGIQETLIEAPSGRHLYSGKGLERNTGLCNRYASVFLATSAPCKEIKEGEKAWDWCFSTKFFFIRKP